MTRVSELVKVQYAIALYVLDCPNCGVIFGITEEFEQRRRSDAKSFYCPNGHSMSWSESDADRLRRELEQARQATARARESEAWARSEMDRERRSHAATKGQLTKTLKRVNAGVCVHCNRTFQQLARHMKSKHAEHGDA